MKIVLPVQENLTRIHDAEEKIRNDSIVYIAANPDIAFQQEIIHTALNLIHDISTEFKSESLDEKTIQLIGFRLFNTSAASYKLILTGYYQAAFALLRDILEISFLLSWFTDDKLRIERWRTMSRKERRKKINPVILYELDKRDGATERKRSKYYWLFCEYATHITPKFPKLLSINREIRIGPFFYNNYLKNSLIELAKLLILCTLPFVNLFTKLPQEYNIIRMEFIKQTKEWGKKYLIPINVKDLEKWLE